MTTREVVDGKSVVQDLQFADYDSLDASCRDYAWLITRGSPYRSAWETYQNTRDLYGLIASVARIYATDPAYTKLAMGIASQTNVATAIKAARTVRA